MAMVSQERHPVDPGDQPIPTATIPQPGCCDLDTASRQALFAYCLSLILKQLGGYDFTDCDTVLAEMTQIKDYDESHADLVLWEMLVALMTLTGTTAPSLTEAKRQSDCLRNNLSVWQLRAMQFVLWDEIVNTYIP